MGILANENAIGGGNYLIERSLRFQSASSQYLSRTPASAGNRQTWTWSGWVKRGSLGADQFLMSAGTTSIGVFGFLAADTFFFNFEYTSNAYVTTQVFRDPSAWYHIVVVADSTNATASNRTRLYVNGTQVTAFSSTSYPAQNNLGYININQLHTIGRRSDISSGYFDGYMAEVNFIDGQALTPSSFGETDALTGVWVAKKYTGTYGTNGFYLKFADGTSTTTLGTDSSGNANNWTLTNFTRSAGTSDCWMYDVPSGNGGASGTQPNSNYATLNNVWAANGLAIGSASNANLKFTGTAGVSRYITGTITPDSGKYYWEATYTTAVANTSYVGVRSADGSVGASGYQPNGAIFKDGGASTTYATYTTGDVIGIAYDATNNTLQFFKNNVSQVTLTGLSAARVNPFINTASNDVYDINFGQRSFAYTPPSGFKALCTANLPSASISNGAKHFATSLVTGTGGVQTVNNTVNNASFQPDFIWWKSRSNASNHILMNSITGVGPFLRSNTTDAEQPSSGLTSYNSNGFSVNGAFDNTYTYAAWQWKGGGTAVTNNSGTISSQVSANTSAGFSIVTYTGTGANATVGHGLGVAPKMVIIKNRTSSSDGWIVGHSFTNNGSSPWNYYLVLSSTGAQTATASAWNNTAPTSSVFTVGVGTGVNGNTNNLVAYCFAEIAGFSKFGSYTGNGSADGPFVFTGFRPKFVMWKRSNAIENWYIEDISRSPFNVADDVLSPNLSSAEVTSASRNIDFLSNGFKQRTADTSNNGSGDTYIFMAFAENPFNYSNAF